MVLSNRAVPREYGAFRDSVLRGETPVNREVSLQMNRIDFLIDSKEYYHDSNAIDGFIDFCEEELTLTDGEALHLLPSFKLWAEDALSWFYFIDERVYDPKIKRYTVKRSKKRLVNKQYLIVGRGAAKSMYASALQAYFLVCDTSTTHQIVTAPTMKQSDETISPIRTAISRSRGPLFSFMTDGSIRSNNVATRPKLYSSKRGIENYMTNSFIEVRPMTIDKLQSLRTKVNTVDEWLSTPIKEDVIGAIEQGASKIKDYLIVATSSEGTVRDGPGDDIKLELSAILNGDIFDPHVSIWHYKLDNIQELNDPEMWLKANPNLGATASYETYQREVDTAETNPAKRSDILAKRFGIPVEGYAYYFTYEETIPHRKKYYDGMTCSLGADMSQGDDFCAFTFLFPLQNGKFGVKTRSYVSEHKVRKLPQSMHQRYQTFVQEGTLVVMEGPYLDMSLVFDDLDEFIVEHDYDVSSLGYDPYNAKYFIERWATENGDFGIVKVPQGARTESVPMGEIKNLADVDVRGLLFDELLMKFSMGNAVAIEDNNGNLKLSKKRAEEKIDNVAALIDAWVAYKECQEVFE